MEQGTVSGCVLDLSRLMGCKKVIFVGQDMAIRDDGRYYTDDSSYSDHGGHFSTITKGHQLPGNTQEKVLVEGRLYVYLKTFEQFIAKNPTVEYRNLARSGVKVKGAPYFTMEEAMSWIGDAKSKPFVDMDDELLASQTEAPSTEEVLSGFMEFAEKLFDLSLAAAMETEMLPGKFAGTNYSDHKTVHSLLAKADEINRMIKSNQMFWNLLFEGQTKSEMVHYKRVIRDLNFANENWSKLQKNKEYFWAISEGCNWLLNLLEEVSKENASTESLSK